MITPSGSWERSVVKVMGVPSRRMCLAKFWARLEIFTWKLLEYTPVMVLVSPIAMVSSEYFETAITGPLLKNGARYPVFLRACFVVLSPTMSVPAALRGVVQERKDRFGGEFLGFAKAAGETLSEADIRNIERWTGKGCMNGVKRFASYLELLGYEINIRRIHRPIT